jgi:hypothetical protein
MRRSRITTGFDNQSDAEFETKTGSIYLSMLDNANFPTPVPPLVDVDALIKSYSQALVAAKDRSKNSVALKIEARARLTAAMVQLASSVSTAANGDKTILISSGFDLARRGEFKPLEKPKNISLKDGINPGELIVKISAVKGAKSYNAQYTADPLTAASVWMQETTTKCKHTFKNLDSTKKYWCRVAAVGSYGQLVYSDAINRVVQ